VVGVRADLAAGEMCLFCEDPFRVRFDFGLEKGFVAVVVGNWAEGEKGASLIEFD
jgi:hypothetical protein